MRRGCAVFTDQNRPGFRRELHINLVHIDGCARIADGAQDAPPVGVGSKHGSLRQRRANDAFSDGLGNFQRRRTGDFALEQLCRALAVARDAATEVDGYGIERLHKGGEVRVLFGDLRITRKTVGQNRHHIVGRGIAIDGNHVEGVGNVG